MRAHDRTQLTAAVATTCVAAGRADENIALTNLSAPYIHVLTALHAVCSFISLIRCGWIRAKADTFAAIIGSIVVLIWALALDKKRRLVCRSKGTALPVIHIGVTGTKAATVDVALRSGNRAAATHGGKGSGGWWDRRCGW